jgi:hypothetical protein
VFPFCASYDSQGLRWKYSNPPPHGDIPYQHRRSFKDQARYAVLPYRRANGNSLAVLYFSSVSYIIRNFFKSTALLAICFHVIFLLGLFFNIEEGGDMIFRNIRSLSEDYISWEPQILQRLRNLKLRTIIEHNSLAHSSVDHIWWRMKHLTCCTLDICIKIKGSCYFTELHWKQFEQICNLITGL